MVIQDQEDGYGDSDSDSDIPDELKHDYIDELTGETHSYRWVQVNHFYFCHIVHLTFFF